jgi:D-glycero-alpha-D-manno-heptose 1-phosphate guanylyltransferase
MEAILLAGGFGRRLQAVVPDLPKPMAPVSGRPFLEILLSILADKGVNRVVLSLGYRAEQISSYFGARYAGMELDYVVEEAPLGTGGGIRLALSRCSSNPVFIFNGDTFLDLEMDAVYEKWLACPRPMIVARRVLDTARYGRLRTQGERVVGFSEKGMTGPGLINAGCYIFSLDQLDAYPYHVPFSIETDYLATAVEKQDFNWFETQGLFLDIGVPEDYARAQIILKSYVPDY